jgi:hypothetical protein
MIRLGRAVLRDRGMRSLSRRGRLDREPPRRCGAAACRNGPANRTEHVARILLQTTISEAADDWHVGRFSLLAAELRRAGHDVTTRNRDAGRDDSRLSVLDTLDYDQLWLMAVDPGDGLSRRDAAGIIRFRLRGGGVLTARDHDNLGSCLLALGSLGDLNHFHHGNPERDCCRDDQTNPHISWPNYHSGADGDYQPVFATVIAHELLRTSKTASGRIEWFPAHPHEGVVSAPPEYPFAHAVALGCSTVTGRHFGLVACLDEETTVYGDPMGRAVADSTFHHFADHNWGADCGAPSNVSDPPGDEITRDPERLEIFKDYVHNLARWLQPREEATRRQASARNDDGVPWLGVRRFTVGVDSNAVSRN